MGEKCCGCGKDFVAGDDAVEWRFVRTLQGEKSGRLGFYEHPNSPEGAGEYVHWKYGCLEKCFSPAENPFMYDTIAAEVRKEIYEDERDYDSADIPLLMEYNEDPPYCLWCKRKDTVWVHYDKGYIIFNCLGCMKLWDDDENELEWDAEEGDYFLAE